VFAHLQECLYIGAVQRICALYDIGQDYHASDGRLSQTGVAFRKEPLVKASTHSGRERRASASTVGNKPWKYLLIPHDQIAENRNFSHYSVSGFACPHCAPRLLEIPHDFVFADSSCRDQGVQLFARLVWSIQVCVLPFRRAGTESAHESIYMD
jgi:hypothetical protein